MSFYVFSKPVIRASASRGKFSLFEGWLVQIRPLDNPLTLLVTIHAHIQSVHLSVSVGAFRRFLSSPKRMITVVAHALSVVFLVRVRTIGGHPLFALGAGPPRPDSGLRDCLGDRMGCLFSFVAA